MKFISINLLLLTFLALIPKVSFSAESVKAGLDIGKSADSFPNDTLYEVKLHYKNKLSKSLVYAIYNTEQQQYKIVCQSEDERYQDAEKRCDALREESGFSFWLI